MTYDYHFDERYPLVYINVKGKDSFSGHIERINRVTSDSKWAPGHNVLIDFTGTTEFEVSNRELEGVAAAQESRNVVIGDGKLAVVAPEDIIFGLTRMWEALVETRTSMEIHVFRNREDAVRWLGFHEKRIDWKTGGRPFVGWGNHG